MMDIDYFKRYNDRYGHLAGDECLKRVAQSLNRVPGRTSDFVARYEGRSLPLFCRIRMNKVPVKSLKIFWLPFGT